MGCRCCGAVGNFRNGRAWGFFDYDADGIVSTAILMLCLGKPSPTQLDSLPERLTEGGLSRWSYGSGTDGAKVFL